MNIGLILSSGVSARFGNGVPKQYSQLNGKEVLSYTIDAMKRSDSIDKIVIAANAEYTGRLCSDYDTLVTVGGESRNQSLKNGLDYISQSYPYCEKVLINEAARPFITPSLVDEYFARLDEYDAVITAKHITDSLGRYGQAVTDRSKYYLIQAPEAFRFQLLHEHFNADSPITATSQQLPPDCRTYLNFDFRHNFKITYAEDLAIAKALMGCLND